MDKNVKPTTISAEKEARKKIEQKLDKLFAADANTTTEKKYRKAIKKAAKVLNEAFTAPSEAKEEITVIKKAPAKKIPSKKAAAKKAPSPAKKVSKPVK